jgi:hypothetical protein
MKDEAVQPIDEHEQPTPHGGPLAIKPARAKSKARTSRRINAELLFRPSPWRSPGSFGLRTNEQNWAAFTLGYKSHDWQFTWELDLWSSPSGARIEPEIRDAMVKLADGINPGVLIELHRLFDTLSKSSPSDSVPRMPGESEDTTAPQGTESSEDTPQGTESDERYFVWLHILLNRAFDKKPELALWFQLGSAIGAFQTSVMRNPCVMPFSGLAAIMEAAAPLVDGESKCGMPELGKLVAGAAELPGRGNIAFLDGVLGREYQPDQRDTEREAMIVYGGLFHLVVRVRNWLLQGAVLSPLPKHKRKGLFPYHEMDERRPPLFQYGPLAGTQKELAKWILARGTNDPRQLEHHADRAIWFQRVTRTMYNAYFFSQELYERAAKRQPEEKRGTSVPGAS